MKRSLCSLLLVVAGLGLLMPQSVLAAGTAVEKGNAHYLLFCANCHGVDGDGKGPLVNLLKVVPSDLTTLQSSGGDLTERVLKAVDGRHAVAEAGGARMPVFSDNLEIRTVIEITEYLKTIQR